MPAPNTGFMRGRLPGARFVVDVAGGGEVTLAAEVALNETLVFTGALTADRTVRVPVGVEDAGVEYQVDNITSGDFLLRFAGSIGSGVIVPQGRGMRCQWNSAQMYTVGDDCLRHDAATLNFTNTSPHTLTRVQAKCGLIIITGSPGGQGTINVPRSAGVYLINNQSDQGFQIKTPSGNGIVIAAARSAMVASTGVDVIRITADVVYTV